MQHSGHGFPCTYKPKNIASAEEYNLFRMYVQHSRVEKQQMKNSKKAFCSYHLHENSTTLITHLPDSSSTHMCLQMGYQSKPKGFRSKTCSSGRFEKLGWKGAGILCAVS